QAERLAVLGQMVAGLAHESRNALQRSQGCLERLRWQLQDRPEALDLVTRTERALDDLHRLFNDVGEYARPIPLERTMCNLAEIWREAWGHLAALHPNRPATLQEAACGVDLSCNVDRFRLGQVFRNILENSFAACADAVLVGVSCVEADLDGWPA